MTNQEINQIIHEARGLCWHDKRYGNHVCMKCHAVDWPIYHSYTSSWADYGPMLEWFKSDTERFAKFIAWLVDFDRDEIPVKEKMVYATVDITVRFMTNPLRGSTAIAEFIVANPQLFGRKG